MIPKSSPSAAIAHGDSPGMPEPGMRLQMQRPIAGAYLRQETVEVRMLHDLGSPRDGARSCRRGAGPRRFPWASCQGLRGWEIRSSPNCRSSVPGFPPELCNVCAVCKRAVSTLPNEDATARLKTLIVSRGSTSGASNPTATSPLTACSRTRRCSGSDSRCGGRSNAAGVAELSFEYFQHARLEWSTDRHHHQLA